MLVDCKYVRKENEREWLDEIEPLVMKFCEDKSKRCCVGWNNIVEQYVWQKLKARHQLKTFPKNLYPLIRSTFEQCLTKTATLKQASIKVDLKKNLDTLIELFKKKSDSCMSINDPIFKKLKLEKNDCRQTLCMSVVSISTIMRIDANRVRLWQSIKNVKQYSGYRYVSNKYDVNLIFNADVHYFKTSKFGVTIFTIDGKVVMVHIDVLWPYAALLECRQTHWSMFERKSLKTALHDCFNDMCERIDLHMSNLKEMHDMLNECTKICE